jgi:hypothetical protein
MVIEASWSQPRKASRPISFTLSGTFTLSIAMCLNTPSPMTFTVSGISTTAHFVSLHFLLNPSATIEQNNNTKSTSIAIIFHLPAWKENGTDYNMAAKQPAPLPLPHGDLFSRIPALFHAGFP